MGIDQFNISCNCRHFRQCSSYVGRKFGSQYKRVLSDIQFEITLYNLKSHYADRVTFSMVLVTLVLDIIC